ncbi:unnamed protein product [Nippostrongylus brasiliensis]|uniref:Uncharacterized protein n=1 Tax=Nippostrongylus brasiliensis TaxID=27835 RepID=A0A3P6ZZI9_NIPBR|nr:unnamed protein product [Nippostrongylus brasiliensis]
MRKKKEFNLSRTFVFRRSRNLFVKADPYFDHGIIQCVNEFVYQRTYKDGLGEITYF